MEGAQKGDVQMIKGLAFNIQQHNLVLWFCDMSWFGCYPREPERLWHGNQEIEDMSTLSWKV